MSFEELLADQLLVRFRVVWMKFGVAADCTVLLPIGKDAEKPQLKSFPLTSEQFSVPPPRYVWWWFSSDWALDVNIRSNHSQLALRRLCKPLWLLWEMLSRAVLVWVKTLRIPVSIALFEPKTNAPTNTCAIGAWCWPTFHYYIKVVHCLSSRVLGCAHVFPTVPLFHSRYGQQLSMAVNFIPWSHLVAHFHPFNHRSGTMIWNRDLFRAAGEDSNDDKWLIVLLQLWWYSMYTYYPSGIHSSFSVSPFNSTFTVWTPEGSSRLGLLTGGAERRGSPQLNVNFTLPHNLYIFL